MAADANPGDPNLPPTGPTRLTPREWLLLLVLASVQFVHLVDFMILMPLGEQFLNGRGDSLRMTPDEFGLVVSAYTLSAGAAGLLLARFLDRFDRKRTLLVLFSGFTVGTLLCALATSYPLLVAARAVAGAFGGVCAATVLAVVGDAFPDERRGTANGIVMAGFSVASVVGAPAGLLLAELGDWRTPFAVLAGLAVAVLAVAARVLPPVRGHLDDSGPPVSLLAVAAEPRRLRAFALMVALVGSSFLMVPFLATFLTANVGLDRAEVKYVYLFGGLAAFFTVPWVGRLSDRRGKLPVFRVLAVGTAVLMVTLSLLPAGAGLAAALAVTTLMFVTTSGRMVPAMAMVTGSASPAVRGRFMSLNSVVQNCAVGLASWVSGLLLGKIEGEPLTGYPLLGALAAGFGLASVFLAGRLQPAPGGLAAPDAEEVRDEEPAEEEQALPTPAPGHCKV